MYLPTVHYVGFNADDVYLSPVTAPVRLKVIDVGSVLQRGVVISNVADDIQLFYVSGGVV